MRVPQEGATGWKQSALARYIFALFIIAVATGLRALLIPLLGYRIPFSFYYPAAVLAAWFGGLGPGFLSVALGALAAHFFFLSPLGSLTLEHRQDWAILGVFLLTGAAVVAAVEAMRRARSQVAAVEATRQRLAAIVDSSEDAIIAVDLTGRILTWNAAAEGILGWSSQEAVGRSVEILLPPEHSEAFFAEIERIRRGGRIAPYETLRRRKDGSVADVALSVSPVRDGSGRIVGASKILRDITAAKAEQRERERTRQLFLATLGHDLRNPLNTITASAYLLERRAPENAQKAVERVQSSANRMARMIDQLLDFTRARLGGGIPLQRRPADLARICGSVVEEIEAQYPDRVRLVTSGNLSGIWDEDRLAQVVSNLIGNALDHGNRERPVFVYLQPKNGDVQIEVVNSGPPIPPELLPRIFDPFRRGPQERYGPQKGLGLGLFIAREIVEAHGGRLDAFSSGDETRFRVTLPCSTAGSRSLVT